MNFSWKISWSVIAPLSLLLTATAIRLYEPAIGTEYRLQIFDRYQQLSPRVPTDVPISIVETSRTRQTKHIQGVWVKCLGWCRLGREHFKGSISNRTCTFSVT